MADASEPYESRVSANPTGFLGSNPDGMPVSARGVVVSIPFPFCLAVSCHAPVMCTEPVATFQRRQTAFNEPDGSTTNDTRTRAPDIRSLGRKPRRPVIEASTSLCHV